MKKRDDASRERARARERERKARTGFGPALSAVMHDIQGGRCAICRRRMKLVHDHCHATGKPRGLLCYGCNMRIQIVEQHGEAALAYLRRPPVVIVLDTMRHGTDGQGRQLLAEYEAAQGLKSD